MFSRAATLTILVLFLLSTVNLSVSVTVNRYTRGIESEERRQLRPFTIPCQLNDILIISAPVVNHADPRYELRKPNGEIFSLEISRPKYGNDYEDQNNFIIATYFQHNKSVEYPLNNYKVFNLNSINSDENNTRITFEEKIAVLQGNDFVIGPLSEEDYGNWVLSIFEKDNGHWNEMFQVITIQIIEYVPAKEIYKNLTIGDTFVFGFAYPISGIESCEFIAPRTTFDRWYTRDQTNLETCRFVVNNVTKDDEGIWKVLGVGRMAYETVTNLHVVINK